MASDLPVVHRSVTPDPMEALVRSSTRAAATAAAAAALTAGLAVPAAAAPDNKNTETVVQECAEGPLEASWIAHAPNPLGWVEGVLRPQTGVQVSGTTTFLRAGQVVGSLPVEFSESRLPLPTTDVCTIELTFSGDLVVDEGLAELLGDASLVGQTVTSVDDITVVLTYSEPGPRLAEVRRSR